MKRPRCKEEEAGVPSVATGGGTVWTHPQIYLYNIREEKSPVNEQNTPISDFPGGTVGGSLPANVGGMGLAPGPGAFHMPRSNGACVPQLLSPRCRAQEPQLLSLLQPQWEAGAPQCRAASARRNWSPRSNKDSVQPQTNKYLLFKCTRFLAKGKLLRNN